MSNATRILIVEDNLYDYELAQREICRSLDSCVFKQVETQKEYLDELTSFQPDIILCDYSLPSFDGMTALKLIRERSSFTPLIIWTATTSEDVAVECMMAGAANYVLKDNIKRLVPAILRAMEERKLFLENKRSEEVIVNLSRFPEENPSPVLRVTRGGTILYANSASKVLLQEWHAAVGDELPSIWKQDVATSFDQGEERSMEVVVGNQCYSILVVPLREAGYINLYGTDITELKQAQRKFQDIFEGSPVGIYQSTPGGQIINANSTMARMYGYSSPEEMINSVSDLARQLYRSPQDRNKFVQLLEAADAVRDFEMENVRKDGSMIWTSTSARAVRDSDGNVLYYEGFMQDMTERRKAQAQIDDLLALNEKILNYSSLGIITYRLTGDCVFANERAASIVGTTVEHLKAQNFHSLKSWKSSGLYALVKDAISTKTLTSGDVHHISTFGKDSWMAVRCVIFQARGEEHLLLSILDITERKLAEEELRQKNEDLRLLNVVNNAVNRGQELDSVIDLLTHELKRIFSAIGSAVYTLSADKRSISMQRYSFAPDIERKVEKLIGFNIPKIEIPVQEGGYFHTALLTKQSAITSDPQKIQDWIREFAETRFLNPLARTAIHKLVPQIYKLLNIRSTITVPLISGEEVIGFLNVSRSELFTPTDLKRIQSIGEHLTSLIQRQQANERVRKSEEFLQGIQNSLAAHVAILDETGVVVQVNEAWREFGDQNGLRSPNYGVGMNYLAVCDASEGDNAQVASEIADAIRQILSGTRHDASVEYPCHSPRENRWFMVHITCFDDGIHKWIILAHENITERKQAENELLQSQAHYQDLFDKSPVSLWEEDFSLVKQRIDALREDGVTDFSEHFDRHPDQLFELASLVRIIDINKTTLDLFHTPEKEDLLGNLATLLEKDGLLHFREELLGLIGPTRGFVWEGPDKTFDGQSIDVVVTGTIPSGYEEDWSRVIVSIVDITERTQAEKRLSESEHRYRALFEEMPVAVWEDDFSELKQYLDTLTQQGITDLRQYFAAHPEEFVRSRNMIRILNVNKTAMEMYQANSKQKLIQSTLQYMGPGEREHWIDDLIAVAEGRTTNQWEGGDETMNNIPIEISLTWAVVPGHEHDYSKVIFTTLDITERKRAENELRASEERFRQLATNIEEVFWMTEAETGRELYISPAVEKVWGISTDTFLREPNIYMNSILPSDRPIVLRGIEREKNGEKVEMEYRIQRTDGSVRWIWDRGFPVFDETGKAQVLAGISTDITERKQSEAEIERHLAELEALYENGLAIGNLLEPKEIGNQIIQTFARYLSWHHVAIRLLNPETDTLELIALNQPGLRDEARTEVEKRFTQMVTKVGQGLSGWAMQTGEAIRTGDVHTHPQYVNTQSGIISGLYMPLKAGDGVIGCISVESDQPDAFTIQDERLLATLANQAAVAFANARLYQSVQQELLERKRAQKALWASETHYRQLADSITDILFELDQDLRYTHWNKASEMFSGIPAEDAIGKSMQEISGIADDVFKRQDMYNSVLKERQAKTFEIEASVNGSRRDLEIRAYPSARGVSVVARDVTERKVFETLLQKRFELIEYATDHSLAEVMQRVIDEISILTQSHIGFLHLLEADQQTITLQAWSTETIEKHCGLDGSGMHHPLDQAGIWADGVRQGRSVIHNNYDALPGKKGFPDGHTPVHREMVVPIIRNEKIVAVIGVGNKEYEYTEQDIAIAERLADYAWDITERRRIESELAQERNQLARRVEERTADLSRANSNLARALRVKDEFLANMSHELRTPLNAILGLSESLSEQVAGPLNEKQARYLSTINESGHHLLSLINDILDLAKIEAGQITLDINKVDINSVCQASLRMIKQLAQKKKQEVSFEIDPDLGLMWADERRLKQMIVNLLSNAVKFTHEAGQLGLEVHGDPEGNKVIISVWDRGIGIDENDMPRLFQSFVQLDSGLAREATGTGLGLALVAQMAQMHGGSVRVESQLGQGSRFTIMLPWEPALAGDTDARLRTTGKFRAIQPNEVRPTILLVEDTQEVVMMLVDYLEMSGFNMITAQDGIDGLTQAKLAHPDLILMDIQMPRMDGFETTMRLRSDPEFKDIPIIALTALAMPNDRQRCMNAGMNEYLSKPVNLKTLSKTIKTFLYQQESKPS